MDAKTLEALQASIEKWKRNAVAKTPTEYTTGSDTCPLCAVFIRRRCEGCPVREQTGVAWCIRTPYQPARDAKYHWAAGTGRARQARIAARAEVAFLESLLPAPLSRASAQADEGR